LAAGGFQVDGLARQARRDTDAAQAIEAVAIAGEQAVGTPAPGLTALQIHPPIAFVGSAGERIAAATIAELRLQQRSHAAGPVIGGSVGIAVLQNAERPGRFADGGAVAL